MSIYNGCTVSFEVPEWFPPERLDYSNPHFYGKGHAWAGSYSHTTNGNSAEDALFKIHGVKEFSRHGFVTVELFCKPELLPKMIERYSERLTRFFNRYKESRGEQ